MDLVSSVAVTDLIPLYVGFSTSAEGQIANAALFAAFDTVFAPISRALGVAVARELQGQDI